MKDLIANYGQIIVDECHHISASSFERIVRKCPAHYRLGLSATVIRKDGQHPIVLNTGRLNRAFQGKKEVWVYNYVDEKVPTLSKMYRKRLNEYRAMGFVVG